MSRAERLIELMITINAKRSFTAGELAEEFSVSKRTILRDLQVLESIASPLYSKVGAAGGYHVLKERILPPIAFSESEVKSIFFAYQSLEYYNDLPFEQETISVLKKILNCIPNDIQYNIENIRRKFVFWTPDRHCSTPLLKELFNIVMNESTIKIEYSSKQKNSVRTIVPIGLYAMDGLWYCPAYCIKSESIKEFRVDRIVKILSIENLSSKKYKVLSSIHDYLKNMEVGTDYHIKINLTDEGVKRCETEFLLARGLKILSKGGYIDMYIPKSTLNWVAEYFLTFGKNATIIEPIELKHLIKSKVLELYNHHCI
ncbi:helix-turn-helix transcriptional regulator [Clostridioides difficile]|uniref:helix-turn-helix transcriptional regulator n=1 Tax=Clostridioides difficile TaxID=1496 RepID=UPI001C1C4620|nr:YafY family protein [Clostridioides difficile]MCP8384950.1 YafY family transcriptional regulator [Clostridioides difficile]HBF0341600.1 YafY family transcriptional regulator [Clostridioides difficile]HBF8834351.1 YafY family transcriptional regulator [Clostridioides difficile]